MDYIPEGEKADNTQANKSEALSESDRLYGGNKIVM